MLFTKMQGLGNDYLYHFGEVENVEELSIRLSERHFGIGSDGIILILHSEKADFMMRIFNADGSEAKMCGNGIRCVGKFVYDNGYTDKTELVIDTLSGLRYLYMTVKDGKVSEVTVNMGKGEVSEKKTINTSFGEVSLTPVSVGNPHAVIITDDAENAPLDTLGREIEQHEEFPGGVNVEFLQIKSRTEVRMRVWERGSGITMACGTGACASVSAAVNAGLCDKNTDISVVLDGGVLKIKILDDGIVYMTGPAEKICDCEVE